MPSKSIRDWATAVKVRFDGVVARYYRLRERVYGRPGGHGDPDLRDRFGDPRADMMSYGGRLEEFCRLMEQYRPERGDELHIRLVQQGPQPKEAGRG